ncbi:MAG: CPBP family intramembrane glutamic endopeptidase [Steroidobacteraceae bacterium]
MNPVELLRRLPGWAEFAIVVGLAFGYFIFISVFTAVHPDLLMRTHHTTATLAALTIVELVLMAVLCPFLWARGWSLRRVGLVPAWIDTALGVGLGLVVYTVYVLLWIAFASAMPDLARSAASVTVVAKGISPAIALINPWVNALFEELFVAGYIITVLKNKRGAWTAVNVSVAIRLSYHLYQGVLGVIAIIPLGLIFGIWYARTGKLWPLIVAHAAIDMVGLLSMAKF